MPNLSPCSVNFTDKISFSGAWTEGPRKATFFFFSLVATICIIISLQKVFFIRCNRILPNFSSRTIIIVIIIIVVVVIISVSDITGYATKLQVRRPDYIDNVFFTECKHFRSYEEFSNKKINCISMCRLLRKDSLICIELKPLRI